MFRVFLIYLGVRTTFWHVNRATFPFNFLQAIQAIHHHILSSTSSVHTSRTQNVLYPLRSQPCRKTTGLRNSWRETSTLSSPFEFAVFLVLLILKNPPRAYAATHKPQPLIEGPGGLRANPAPHPFIVISSVPQLVPRPSDFTADATDSILHRRPRTARSLLWAKTRRFVFSILSVPRRATSVRGCQVTD